MRFTADICMNKLLKKVNDSAISASSEWTGVRGYYFGPERARLESGVIMVGNIVQSGGWRAALNTLDQYIQVLVHALWLHQDFTSTERLTKLNC